MHYPVVYVILKRLRAPLILLILAYTIATAGMAIIPGVDEQGKVVHLTIFQAFYFISYVATTIGFGEIPYALTDIQRLWVVFCIYLTVISWLVAIGNIVSLLQDPALKIVWRKQRFIKQTSRFREPFFIICGYGKTGELLLQQLNLKGYQCVVIDNNPERINLLDLDSNIYNVPYLLGDVSDVETLISAGLENPCCRAVLAVTNDDKTNVKVALTTKLVKQNIQVICRSQTKEATVNAKSFSTDVVVNASRIYAETLSRAFRTPAIYRLSLSLLKQGGQAYEPPLMPPKGHWIICGHDKLGQEMARFLDYEGMYYTVISDDSALNIPHVVGRGIQAVTLRAANIDDSVGLIAATDDDTDNLSIIMTARQLNPNLFLVALQNQESNRLIFNNAHLNSVMDSSWLLTWHILPLITQPVLSDFLRLARHQDDDWAERLMQRLHIVTQTVPETYLIEINEQESSAVMAFLQSGNILRLQDLFAKDKDEAYVNLVTPLMLVRDGREELLPKLSTPIKAGDVFLLASTRQVKEQVLYTVSHDQDLYYVIYGEEKPVSIVMHMLKTQWQRYQNFIQRKRK